MDDDSEHTDLENSRGQYAEDSLSINLKRHEERHSQLDKSTMLQSFSSDTNTGLNENQDKTLNINFNLLENLDEEDTLSRDTGRNAIPDSLPSSGFTYKTERQLNSPDVRFDDSRDIPNQVTPLKNSSDSKPKASDVQISNPLEKFDKAIPLPTDSENISTEFKTPIAINLRAGSQTPGLPKLANLFEDSQDSPLCEKQLYRSSAPSLKTPLSNRVAMKRLDRLRTRGFEESELEELPPTALIFNVKQTDDTQPICVTYKNTDSKFIQFHNTDDVTQSDFHNQDTQVSGPGDYTQPLRSLPDSLDTMHIPLPEMQVPGSQIIEMPIPKGERKDNRQSQEEMFIESDDEAIGKSTDNFEGEKTIEKINFMEALSSSSPKSSQDRILRSSYDTKDTQPILSFPTPIRCSSKAPVSSSESRLIQESSPAIREGQDYPLNVWTPGTKTLAKKIEQEHDVQAENNEPTNDKNIKLLNSGTFPQNVTHDNKQSLEHNNNENISTADDESEEDIRPKRRTKRQKIRQVYSQKVDLVDEGIGTVNDPISKRNEPDLVRELQCANQGSLTKKPLNNKTKTKPIPLILRDETFPEVQEDDIICESSVWASYAYKKNRFPAKILGKGETLDFKVIFAEDSSIGEVKRQEVSPLDIQIGDTVRINKCKQHVFVVTGLECTESIDIDPTKFRCVRGYDTVVVTNTRIANGKEQKYPITAVYMTPVHWAQYLNKRKSGRNIFTEESSLDGNFYYKNMVKRRGSRRNTRAEPTYTVNTSPESLVFGSSKRQSFHDRSMSEFNGKDSENDIFNIRNTMSKKGKVFNLIKSLGREKYNSKSSAVKQIFKDSLFCITFSDEKTSLINQILIHGGTVVDHGFMDCFKINIKSKTNEAKNNEDIQNSNMDISSKESSDKLEPIADLNNYNFAAVISHSYRRSSKYVQSLALGWPILAEQFIIDCNSQNAFIEKWRSYLLPSGQSLYLDTVQSYDIFDFITNWKNGMNLTEQYYNRKLFLKEKHVIMFILPDRKDTKDEKLAEFILMTMGALSFSKCYTYEDLVASLISFQKLRLFQETKNSILIYVCGKDERDKRMSKSREEDIWFRINEKLVDTVYSKNNRGNSRSKTSTNAIKTVRRSSRKSKTAEQLSPTRRYSKQNKGDIPLSNELKLEVSHELLSSTFLVDWEWIIQCLISGQFLQTRDFYAKA